MSDREYSEGDFLNPRAPPGGISPGSRSINAPSRSGNHGGPEKEGEGKRIILKQVELPCEFCGCMVLAGEEEMGKDAAGLERLCYKCAKSKWVMCVNCGTENTQHPMGRCKTCCRESARLPEGGSMGCSGKLSLPGTMWGEGRGGEDGSNEGVDEDTPPEVPPKDEKWKRHARCFSDPSGAVMTPSEVVGRRHQSTSAMGVPPRKKGGRREEEFRGLG